MNPQFGMGMGMGMGFGMPNMMQMPVMNNQLMNMDADEEWMKGFKMGVEEVNSSGAQDEDANKPGPKLNVIFKTTQGTTHTMVYTYGTTIEQALEKYLKRVGRPELINDNTNKICFLFNATQLKFGNKTKVEVFFKNINNPKVVVNDVNNLIGA